MIHVILNWSKLELKIFLWVPTVITYMIKKELGVYLCVPGNAGPKTDFGRFGYHPKCMSLHLQNTKAILIRFFNLIFFIKRSILTGVSHGSQTLFQ